MAQHRGDWEISKDLVVDEKAYLKGNSPTTDYVLKVIDGATGEIGFVDPTTLGGSELDTTQAAVGTDTDGTYIPHSGSNYLGSNTTFREDIEDLDAQVGTNASDIGALQSGKQNVMSVAAGSTQYLSISSDEISVSNLLITDVFPSIESNIADFISNDANYANAGRGDVIVLTGGSVVDGETTYIHNGGVAGTAADFSLISDPVNLATIRNALSAGSGITYSAGGEIAVSGDAGQVIDLSGSYAYEDATSAPNFPAIGDSIEEAIAALDGDIRFIISAIPTIVTSYSTSITSGSTAQGTYDTTGSFYRLNHGFDLDAGDEWKFTISSVLDDGADVDSIDIDKYQIVDGDNIDVYINPAPAVGESFNFYLLKA